MESVLVDIVEAICDEGNRRLKTYSGILKKREHGAPAREVWNAPPAVCCPSIRSKMGKIEKPGPEPRAPFLQGFPGNVDGGDAAT